MKGFTMIELLVVIAIIGVLAVAVLSSINPIEQINKGRDTRARSDAAELLAASERYFTTSEQMAME
jgi:prepilin-type N-terminal cleavage/methylation domain-containing protein